MRAAAEAAGRPVIQFRIDDDDALSRDHIARIRHHAARLTDMPTFALANPNGLIFGSLDGGPVQYFRSHRAFVSAGATVRMDRPGASIYAHPHFALPNVFPAFTILDGLGYVQSRWDMGDTSGVTPRRMTGWTEIDRAAFEAALADDFPFLRGEAFDHIAGPNA